MADNSFDARAELQVGDRTFEIYRLDALQSKFDVARLPFSLKVLLENLLRNEDGVGVRADDIEALASWDHSAEPSKEIAFTPARVVLQDFTGVPVRGRPRRDARRDGRPRRRPGQDQPARPGRARHRPLRAGRRLRHARRLPHQRREGVRAQQGALRVPALGPDRLRGLQGRAAGHRHRPPGQPRVPRARRLHERRDRARRPGPGLPRHARRHRLAHDDDQRPRRARLGRRRHRGRGRDARPADVDADPARRRLQAARRPARGRHGDRPRAHRHRRCCASTASSAKFVEFYGARRPEPAAGRPRDDRQHVAGVRLDLRDLPDRRRDAALPRVLRAARRSASSSSRPTPASRACGTTRTPRSRPTPRRWSSTSARSCRRWPAPSARRTASR